MILTAWTAVLAGQPEPLEEISKQLQRESSVFQRFLQELPDKALNLGLRVGAALLIFALGSWLIRLLLRLLAASLKRTKADVGVSQFLHSLVKIILYVILLSAIAARLGIEATGMAALVGSLGVTLGLAVQGSLSNFVGGVLILLLRPFKVGDYIIEDSHKNEGTVTAIRIFNTYLTTPDDKVIILPNGNLANTSLTNFTATPFRRLDLQVGISYEADIRQVKELLQQVLEADTGLIREREHFVYVDSLGDSAVILGIRCWFLNDDYWPARWRLTEAVKYALDGAGVSIPFPQLEVHQR